MGYRHPLFLFQDTENTLYNHTNSIILPLHTIKINCIFQCQMSHFSLSISISHYFQAIMVKEPGKLGDLFWIYLSETGAQMPG